jgi:hypothetical protein
MDTAGNLLFIVTRTLGRVGAPLLVAAILLALSLVVVAVLMVDALTVASETSLVAPLRWFTNRC